MESGEEYAQVVQFSKRQHLKLLPLHNQQPPEFPGHRVREDLFSSPGYETRDLDKRYSIIIPSDGATSKFCPTWYTYPGRVEGRDRWGTTAPGGALSSKMASTSPSDVRFGKRWGMVLQNDWVSKVDSSKRHDFLMSVFSSIISTWMWNQDTIKIDIISLFNQTKIYLSK